MAYKIFISHVWRAQNRYYLGLIQLLADAKRIDFHDLSIPKFRPLDGDYSAVRDDVLRALRSADVVLVINTPILTKSGPVQDELNEAERLGIPIVAVSPSKREGLQRQSQCPAIQRVTHRAKWTTGSLVEKIRIAAKARARVRPVVDFAHDDYEPIENAPVLSRDFASLLMRSPTVTQPKT